MEIAPRSDFRIHLRGKVCLLRVRTQRMRRGEPGISLRICFEQLEWQKDTYCGRGNEKCYFHHMRFPVMHSCPSHLDYNTICTILRELRTLWLYAPSRDLAEGWNGRKVTYPFSQQGFIDSACHKCFCRSRCGCNNRQDGVLLCMKAFSFQVQFQECGWRSRWLTSVLS